MTSGTYRPPGQDLLRWVARQVHIDARVTVVDRLTGGITADLDRITVHTPTGTVDVVLRRWAGQEPDAAELVAREAEGLAAMVGHEVPVPLLLATDDGSATGLCCTLTTALDGVPDLAPTDRADWIHQLATTQAAIHTVPHRPQVRWHRWADRDRPLAWLTDRGLREAARDAASGPLSSQEVFVHGDYQHFNVLWSRQRLTGVVDWPNAATGHRGSDVGHCRLNLAVLFDAETAARYLTAYERAAGAPVDRRADLQALLCFDLDWRAFIPLQVAGRAEVDLGGMVDRVAATVRAAVESIDG